MSPRQMDAISRVRNKEEEHYKYNREDDDGHLLLWFLFGHERLHFVLERIHA